MLLPIATVAIALFATAPLFSQAAPVALVTLPEAPAPQTQTEMAESSADSSSSLPDPVQTAQTQPSQTATPQTPTSDDDKKQQSEQELQRELHQRMGVVVPNFNAVLDGVNIPLTPGQKMRAAFRSAIDPYQFGLAMLTSAVGQAENSHSSYDPIPGTNPVQYMEEGYEQGWEGYGKRLGASYTDQFDGTILGNGVFPVLLHQDSRYYRMGKGSFKKRFLYSLSTTVVCKGDNGKWQPNISNVLGNLAAGGISNLYYPAADRGFGLTMEQGFLVTGEGAFGALLIEFYPDISRHFHKKHLPPDPSTQGQATIQHQ
jgi:hypothetical protein